MPTFWFSYSTIHGLDAPEPPNSPYSLTWNLGNHLRRKATERGYEFRYVNLDDTSDYPIGAEDVILAHSWYPSGFLTNTLDKPVKARFLIQPYQHDIVGRNESWWIKRIVDQCDHCFFVTGQYWRDTMHEGLYGDWKAKSTRLDMATNPALHPFSKRTWNPPGKRTLLSIGADIPYKGLDLVAELARISGTKLVYYGNAPYERFMHVPQMVHNGGREFSPDVIQQIADDCDAFVSLAIGDANPTTLLETACWGLLPMCNIQSGYWPDKPFLELRKDDKLFNLRQLDWLQAAPEYELRQRAECIRETVMREHMWAIFCDRVWSEVQQWL